MDNYSTVDYLSEFKKYAMQHMGVSGLQFHYWEKLQNELYSNVNIVAPVGMKTNSLIVEDSLTPYILEERELRVTQMDIFSRLMMDRILWLAGPVNDQMSTVVQAQLMFLSNLDASKDITMHIDSPGGSVKSGLSIVDLMDYIPCDVRTICTGMAASMGSILLGAGTKGKRHMLRFSKVMLHQVSHGVYGNIQDTRISMEEGEKYNDILFGLLADYTGKEKEQVLADAQRDLWLDADSAIKYGIVDSLITK